MEVKRLKITLVVLQVVPLIALTALATASSAARKGEPSGDGVVVAALALVYVPMIANGIVGGILASKMKRSVAGWVLACVFLPLIGPLLLASRQSLERRAGAQGPDAFSVPAAEGEGSVAPNATFNPGGFCRKCLAETTDESTGNVTSFNGIGTTLMGTRWRAKGLDPCGACGSVVQTKWATFGIGFKPLGTYRVIYTKKGLTTSRFFARRLRNDPVGGGPGPQDGTGARHAASR